jgi:sulfotransferase family protein
VFVCPLKEPNFFSWGLGDDPPPPNPWRTVVRDPDKYRRLFEGATDETAIGEASVSYLRVPGTAARIRHHVPHAKLVAVLRDPIARAYSVFLMRRRTGLEPSGDFIEAVAAGLPETSESYQYLDRVGYARHLQRYLEHFPGRQLRVYLYDDLRSDPTSLLSDVYRFLGVDDRFQPDTSRRYNVAGINRSHRVQRFLDGFPRPVRSTTAALVTRRVTRRLYWTLRDWNTKPPPPLPRGARSRFLPFVRDDVLELQDLIGRDLSAWLLAEDG